MPSSKAPIDLEPWTKFSPKERQNDYEYNLLLSKFKSLLSEVKSLQIIHRNCSLSQGDNLNGPNSSQIERNLSSPARCEVEEYRLSPSSGKNVIAPNGILNFQSQNPIVTGSSILNESTQPDNRNRSHVSNLSRLYNQQSQHNPMPKHYNSSHNLLLSSSTNINNTVATNRSDFRQRGQVVNSRLLASKSSEKLDSILDNNNHSPFIKTKDLGIHHSTHSSPPIARDSKYFANDDNIYDAVSPDDLSNTEPANQHVANSVNNLNRLSLQHRSKLEPLKSSPVVGNDSGKFNSPYRNLSSSNKFNVGETLQDQERLEQHSFGSSVLLDPSINNSSSLSIQNEQSSQDQSGNLEYANYVNIDFFLKRGDSPSIDDLDENMTQDDSSDVSDDEEATRMSHSFSSDQLCEHALRDLTPRELAKKLSCEVNTNSSSSLTPASSGDFLDDSRGQSSMNASSASSARFKEANNKLASFFSMSGRGEVEHSSLRKNSTNPRDSIGLMKNLGPIHESSSSFMLSRKNTSLDTYMLEGKDCNALAEAHTTMRSFLSDLNLSPVDDLFEDKAQRRIVKESFAVEFCKRRKLRHLFLFNDVIVCAKYQASSKQKFTFDVKWYLNLGGISVLDPSEAGNHVKYDKEAIENQILAIRTNLMMLRSRMQHIKRSKDKQPAKLIKKLKKSRTELEAELVLLLPHLPLVIKHINGRKYTFFLSSNFDRNQWIESIKFLQSQLTAAKSISSTPSSSELQAWIQTCRKNLNPSLGTFLLRSNCDDDLLYGDLYLNLSNMRGIAKQGNYYFCFEVDSYGHFSQKASSSVMRIEKLSHDLNEEYVFPLDGAHTLRILLYENLGSTAKPAVVGKAHVELSRSWFLEKSVDKVIVFNTNCSLSIKLSYSSSELLSMRIPHTKLCPNFGMDITQVCKKEKTNIPLLIQLCVNEVERRGMREVGIYRMSGTSTDIQRLKKTFETNSYVAELLLRDIDIHSVTGFLKTYLREMPEGLFINKLYLKFVAAFNIPQSDSHERTRKMLELFARIPPTNQQTIIYLVEHLVKINKYESYNKMSLTNLATVIGPNILRPPTDTQSQSNSDPFTAVVIGSMSQAGILYFFLNRTFLNLPIAELDPSEIDRGMSG